MEDNKKFRDYSLAYVLRIVQLEEKLLSGGKGVLLVQELLRTALAVDEEMLRIETIRPRLLEDFFAGVQQSLPLVQKSLYYLDLLREAACLDGAEHASLYADGSAFAGKLQSFIRAVKRKAKLFENRKKREEQNMETQTQA